MKGIAVRKGYTLIELVIAFFFTVLACFTLFAIAALSSILWKYAF